MSDGRILKPDKDFSKDADKQIPEAEKLAKVRTMDKLVSSVLLTRELEQYLRCHRQAFAP